MVEINPIKIFSIAINDETVAKLYFRYRKTPTVGPKSSPKENIKLQVDITKLCVVTLFSYPFSLQL